MGACAIDVSEMDAIEEESGGDAHAHAQGYVDVALVLSLARQGREGEGELSFAANAKRG